MVQQGASHFVLRGCLGRVSAPKNKEEKSWTSFIRKAKAFSWKPKPPEGTGTKLS
jgi:hypothetical protein